MKLAEELYRKAFHLLMLIIPITYYFLGKWQSLTIFAPIAALLFAIDFARQKNTKFNALFAKMFNLILREKEKNGTHFCGATYVGLATCICIFFFSQPIVITAFIILAISDTLAALVGKSIKSPPFFEKSRAGSAAFAISALIILISCGLFFEMKPWFYLCGLFAVFCTTMFEARPSLVEIDDNFAIPVGFSLVMTFFDIALNYNF